MTNNEMVANALRISRDTQATVNAVVKLWREQTLDERVDRMTRWDNDRGFAIPDAKVGSMIAHKALCGQPLTEAELAVARRMVYKYRRQLFNLREKTVLRARVKVA